MHFFVVAGAIFFLIMFVSSPNTRNQNNSLLDDGHRRHWTKLTLTKQRNINLNTKSFSSVPALLCIFVLHTASMYLFCLGNWEYMHGVVGWHNVWLYTIYADKYQATIYLYLYACASVCDAIERTSKWITSHLWTTALRWWACILYMPDNKPSHKYLNTVASIITSLNCRKKYV